MIFFSNLAEKAWQENLRNGCTVTWNNTESCSRPKKSNNQQNMTKHQYSTADDLHIRLTWWNLVTDMGWDSHWLIVHLVFQCNLLDILDEVSSPWLWPRWPKDKWSIYINKHQANMFRTYSNARDTPKNPNSCLILLMFVFHPFAQAPMCAELGSVWSTPGFLGVRHRHWIRVCCIHKQTFLKLSCKMKHVNWF